MKTLPKPLLDIKVEDIYAECVQGFSNKQKREKLLSCKDLIIIMIILFHILWKAFLLVNYHQMFRKTI